MGHWTMYAKFLTWHGEESSKNGWVNQKERCMKKPHEIPLSNRLIGNMILKLETEASDLGK